MEERTANVVKLAGEIFVPGASQMIEGRVGSGAAHYVVGGLLVAALAPAAPLLAGLVGLGVRLNSFSSSVYGKNIWNQVEVHVDHSKPPATPHVDPPRPAGAKG